MPKTALCIKAVEDATGGKLTPDEVNAAIEAMDRASKRAHAEAGLEGHDARLRELAEQAADDVEVLAALQQKHAALNAIVRDQLESTVSLLHSQGLTYSASLLSILEGSLEQVKLGRFSVDYQQFAYLSKFAGEPVQAKISAERPHIWRLIDDKSLNDDIVREMAEIKEGGRPGVTGNDDAKWMAALMAASYEMSRTTLNKFGANIRKLDGYAGQQSHDDAMLIRHGEQTWIDDTLPDLDIERTFHDLAFDDPAAIQEAMHDLYLTLVTGRNNKISAAERGERVGPANIGKALSEQHRMLHFKDADAWIRYRDKYGYTSAYDSWFKHQQRAARLAAQMEILGPNPHAMLQSLTENLIRKVRNDSAITPAEKQIEIARLEFGPDGFAGHKLADAYLEMRGFTMSSPLAENNVQRVMGTARNLEASAKMGTAVASALPPDQLMAAGAAMFRGSSFWRTFSRQIGGLFHRIEGDERIVIARIFDANLNSARGDVMRAQIQKDLMPGMAAKFANMVYKYSGFTWETDVTRKMISSGVSAEFGERAGKVWSQLPERYRLSLGTSGLEEAEWNIIRSGVYKAKDGISYVTPDRIADAPDALFQPIVERKLVAVDPSKVTEAMRARFLEQARHETDMAVRRYVIDQLNFANPVMDASGRRILYRGTRPGSVAGAALRMLTQFKGFTILVSRNHLYRMWRGGGPDLKFSERLNRNGPQLGMLLAGLTVAGYASMVMKDIARGQWPPRDPLDYKTLAAAFLQGGGMSIYGDYVFGEMSRYGQSPLESFAGPIPGSASQVIQLFQKMRNSALNATFGRKNDDGVKAADFLNILISHTPFQNLWWSRAAVDYLFLNALRESVSPGYVQRKRNRLQDQFGQDYVVPAGPLERPRPF